VALLGVRAASAQVTPAAGYTPPDDTPSIRVGVTIYADYTYTDSPQTKDADGNVINASAFNVARSYINVTGNINHMVAFRITPDIVRQSGLITLGPGSSISNDSLLFRIKYAFAQFNLDDWMTKGSWVRLGIQQTPWVDFEEGVYRYRFQGTIFEEREGFLSSSDVGISGRFVFPQDYGDIHAGYYNGDTKVGWRFNIQRKNVNGGSWSTFYTSSYQTSKADNAVPAYTGHGFARRTYNGPSNSHGYYWRVTLDLKWWGQTNMVEGNLSLKYDWYKAIRGGASYTNPDYCLQAY
jgi:hypothetical protein